MDLPARVRQASARTVDVLVVVLVAFPTTMDAWWNEPGTRQADAITYVTVAVSLAALLVRRRWPLAVCLVTGVGLTVLYRLGHHGELLNLPVMAALYTAAISGTTRRTVVLGAIASAWSGVLGITSDDPLGARGGSPVLEMLWPLVPLVVGEAVRSRRDLAARASADREREAADRLQAERRRMARELHDVVAHTMSAVNVQMAAAAAAFDDRPAVARDALEQARRSSRDAFRELRAAVGLLRDEVGHAPAPRLDGLPALLETARTTGLEVTLRDDRDGFILDGATELAAYRIVQEALTNTRRHSNSRQVTVSLSVPDRQQLVIEVVDQGTGCRPASSGFGLLGMEERARALEGTLEHGPTASGGFCVRAALPVGGPCR